MKSENLIEIYEIPYTTTAEAILDKVAELIKLGKVREVADMRDETDLSGLKLAIDLEAGHRPGQAHAEALPHHPLQDSFAGGGGGVYSTRSWPPRLPTRRQFRQSEDRKLRHRCLRETPRAETILLHRSPGSGSDHEIKGGKCSQHRRQGAASVPVAPDLGQFQPEEQSGVVNNTNMLYSNVAEIMADS